jgi:hypothetical protein
MNNYNFNELDFISDNNIYDNINNNNNLNNANDIPLINEMSEKNEKFCKLMKKRIDGLKIIATSCRQNNTEDAIAEIGYLKDLGVANDYLNYSLIKKDIKLIYLNNDEILKLFPTILLLLESKYDNYFKTAYQSAYIILKLYQNTIIDAKTCAFVSGVDLNREEKLKKYEKIIDFFYRIRISSKVAKNMNNNLELQKFLSELDYFLKKCK